MQSAYTEFPLGRPPTAHGTVFSSAYRDGQPCGRWLRRTRERHYEAIELIGVRSLFQQGIWSIAKQPQLAYGLGERGDDIAQTAAAASPMRIENQSSLRVKDNALLLARTVSLNERCVLPKAPCEQI